MSRMSLSSNASSTNCLGNFCFSPRSSTAIPSVVACCTCARCAAFLTCAKSQKVGVIYHIIWHHTKYGAILIYCGLRTYNFNKPATQLLVNIYVYAYLYVFVYMCPAIYIIHLYNSYIYCYILLFQYTVHH